MNINEVKRRSTSKIRQRHHRAAKPGSVQAEQSRTERTELLECLTAFLKETNSVDCIKKPDLFYFFYLKSEDKDAEKR